MTTPRKMSVAVCLLLLVMGLGYQIIPPQITTRAERVPTADVSLTTAIQAARYNLSTAGSAVTALNPAQQMRASFTPEHVQIESTSACQQPWQLGLQLKGYGYGPQLHEVRAGEIATRDNRVEIRRSVFNPKSKTPNPTSRIIEWYTNTPNGLEQGFTLNERPPQTTTEPLRVVLSLQGDWQAQLDADQQALTLRNTSTTLRYDQLHTFDATGRELTSRMEVQGQELALVVEDANAVWPLTIDPTLSQQTQFIANNGAAYDQFSYSVAISGDTAIVGVPDNDAGGTFNQGAAYVFVRNGSAWSQQAQLTANDAANNDAFGWAVAISGNTAIIGAYNDDVNGSDQGSAYVFVRNGSTWSQQAKLTASDGATNDWFGHSVAVSGDLAVIGAPLNDNGFTGNQGAAYVFVRNGTTWMQETRLRATDGTDNDNFGFAVALNGDTAVIGSSGDDVNGNSDQGSAYVFVRSGTTWSQQQQLIANNGASSDDFGHAVAINGNTAVIGAPLDDVGANSNQGSAYVFVRSGTTWSQQQQLIANNGAGADQFGNAVAIDKDIAVVGAPTDDVSSITDQGSAYIFTRSGTTWSQQQQVTASNGAVGDGLGWSIAVSGFTVVAGAPTDDVSANTDQGSAYIFSPTCPSITLNPTNLPDGTQNLAYSATTILPSAGTSPFVYEITSGALPSGLSLSASGVLSGTPTVAGSFNFTIKISDTNLCNGSRTYSLNVASCAPPSVTTQPTNQTSSVAGSASFTAIAGGTPPSVQWQVSTDNGGTWTNLNGATNTTLNLSNLTITMHGYQYRAVFTNACGTATSNAATLTVNKLTPTVTLNTSSPSLTYGQNVTLTAAVSGAVAATGNVTFKNGTATLGTATLNNGQAMFTSASLPAGDYALTAEYSGDTNYVNRTSTTLAQTITKATLTVQAENKTKTYGAANPELSASITGFVNGETSSVITGAAALATAATPGSNVGSYPITATQGTLAAANYDFTFSPGTLSIGKASLTVQAENKNRIYGAANPSLTATISGFVDGENSSVLQGEATLSTTATTNSAAGNYPITVTPGTLTATNYDFTFVNGTLTISKATLTVQADNKGKLYGAANPDLTATITGFLNGDTSSVVGGAAALNSTATANSGVGNYPITVTQGTLTATNYDFSFVSGTLVISKATLTVAADNKSRSYGAANPTLTGSLTPNTDNITASFTTTATTASATGNYDITPVLHDPDNKLGNYEVTTTNGTLSIIPVALTVTADAKARMYGASNPELTATITGFVTGETSSTLGGMLQLSTTATTASAVGSYPITASGLTSTNYTINYVSGVLTISKARLTVQADNKTKSYGAPTPTLTASINGLVNGDSPAVVSGTAAVTTEATETSGVGEYPIIAAAGTLAAANYEFEFLPGKLTVGKATLTVTADNQSRSYGAANPNLTATISGFVNGDSLSTVTGEPALGVAATSSSQVGTYPITVTQGTLTATNYDFSFVPGTLTIGKATLTVVADNKTKVYGAENPDLSATITGFVNGETASVLQGGTALSTTATRESGAGIYPITVTQNTLTATNYDFAFSNGSLTITKATLTVQAENKTKTYGAANPELSASITGFVNGETSSVITGAAALATAATPGSNVGSYPITATQGTLAAANYDFTFSPGTLSIGKVSLTVQAENKNRIYGAANPSLTATISGFVNGENSSVLQGEATLSTTATTNSAAGNYPITVTQGTLTATNYDFSFVPGTLSIGKTTLTITAENKTKVFGASLPEFTLTYAGFVNGDSASSLTGAPHLTTTATANSNVGNYPITVSAGTLTATSYEFVFVNGGLTITPANTTVALVSNLPSALLGQSVTFTATVNAVAPGAGVPSGNIIFKNGATTLGTVALSNGQATLTTNQLTLGTHTITAGYSGTDNFTASTSPALSQSVGKAGATVTLASAFDTARYGQTITLNATVSGAGAAPTGDVQFMNGTTLLGSASLTQGTASLAVNTLPVGTHSITAVYPGDTQTEGGTSRSFALTISKAMPTLHIAASANPAAWKQFITLALQVETIAPGLRAPTGNIVFKDGSTVLGTFALNRLGRATLTTNQLTPGARTITAEFSGDDNYETRRSVDLPLTIGKGQTTMRLRSAKPLTSYGQAASFTAAVFSTGDMPTGVVEFFAGETSLGEAPLYQGLATLTTTALPTGDHSISALYKGEERFATTRSSAVKHQVSPLCTWHLSSTSQSFSAQGGFGNITVEALQDCYWYAYSTAPWITITDFGPEVGAVSFLVSPLTTDTARTGTIFIADKRVTVVQAKTATSVSGASFQAGGIAANSIVSVFGEGMAAATEAAQAIPLPQTLANTKVKITDSTGSEHFAPLFYVSPLQINYQLPAEVALGPALVTIQSETGQITNSGMIEVTPIAPAVFSANSSGKDLAAANIQRVRVDGSQSFEPIARWDAAQNKIVPIPIAMGEEGEEVFLVLYGTGIRSRVDLLSVRATVNQEDAEVLYADTQGYFVGVDQMNLRLPRKLAGKGDVEVKLLVEDKVVNTVRINLQ